MSLSPLWAQSWVICSTHALPSLSEMRISSPTDVPASVSTTVGSAGCCNVAGAGEAVSSGILGITIRRMFRAAASFSGDVVTITAAASSCVAALAAVAVLSCVMVTRVLEMPKIFCCRDG